MQSKNTPLFKPAKWGEYPMEDARNLKKLLKSDGFGAQPHPQRFRSWGGSIVSRISQNPPKPMTRACSEYIILE
jgi:hypothetical protein